MPELFWNDGKIIWKTWLNCILKLLILLLSFERWILLIILALEKCVYFWFKSVEFNLNIYIVFVKTEGFHYAAPLKLL